METTRRLAGILLLVSVLSIVGVKWANVPVMAPFMKAANHWVHLQSGTGVLAGNVTRGPLSPLEVPGSSRPPAPVPGARIIISALDGREVTSVGTNERGQYSVPLPPGIYRIDLGPLAANGFS